MNVETKFWLNDIVIIKELEVDAVVRQIRLDSVISYLVTYWHNGKLEEVWLSEWELNGKSD